LKVYLGVKFIREAEITRHEYFENNDIIYNILKNKVILEGHKVDIADWEDLCVKATVDTNIDDDPMPQGDLYTEQVDVPLYNLKDNLYNLVEKDMLGLDRDGMPDRVPSRVWTFTIYVEYVDY